MTKFTFLHKLVLKLSVGIQRNKIVTFEQPFWPFSSSKAFKCAKKKKLILPQYFCQNQYLHIVKSRHLLEILFLKNASKCSELMHKTRTALNEVDFSHPTGRYSFMF